MNQTNLHSISFNDTREKRRIEIIEVQCKILMTLNLIDHLHAFVQFYMTSHLIIP